MKTTLSRHSPLPVIKVVTPASKRMPATSIDTDKADCDEPWGFW